MRMDDHRTAGRRPGRGGVRPESRTMRALQGLPQRGDAPHHFTGSNPRFDLVDQWPAVCRTRLDPISPPFSARHSRS